MRRGRLPSCETSAIPPRLQQILDRAIAKEPRDRYQKMEEMRDELRKVLQEVSASESSWSAICQSHAGTTAPFGRDKSRFSSDALVEIDHED